MTRMTRRERGPRITRDHRSHMSCACVLLSLAVPAQAGVVEVAITERHALAEGRVFSAGPYEELKGAVRFAVDPADPHNAIITDIAQAPRNSQGKVEFTADIVIWKPTDLTRGNQVTVVDIPNRGNLVMTAFNRPTPQDPVGDGFLMNEGYSIVWIGWEYDSPAPDGVDIEVPAVPGVENSAIAGLGMAAVRDIGSWIAYDPEALVHSDHVMSFGLSQSGRFLRTFLYHGFNEDEQGRQVFDGMMPHIAGASRLDINRRGAQPVQLGMYDATAFPFTDAAYADPVTSAQEGLLDNARARNTQPKIFYTNSGTEYWGGGRVAALTHTLPDGSADIALQDNVRSYYLASTQHGPGVFPPAQPGVGQLQANPLDYWWNMRALLTALKDWVVSDVEPPSSRYPMLRDQSLVSVDKLQFPALTGVHALDALDAGTRALNPLLQQGGGAGAAIPFLVPQTDSDGNDMGGIRHPELSVPLATYTGWNFQNLQTGNADQLVPLVGSYIPFAATKAARDANHDPRLSIAERYPNKDAFLAKVQSAAEELVAERYLLQRDLPAILDRAGAHWDHLAE